MPSSTDPEARHRDAEALTHARAAVAETEGRHYRRGWSAGASWVIEQARETTALHPDLTTAEVIARIVGRLER